MKAVVYFGKHDARVSNFKEPPMGEDCVKIAVSYCGICGTDIHKFNGMGGSRPVIPPVVLGHEASGIVVDVGSKVTNFKVGDRVVADPNWSCGHCYYCKNGKTHLCENSRGVVKGFAEYICPPESNVYKIPDSLSMEHAALTEPLSCSIHGMDLAEVKTGDTVLIVGMGSIGSMMVELARISGASNIIVVEPVKEKEPLAKKLGATLFIDPTTQNVNQVIKDAGIENVQHVIECVGLKNTIENSFEYAGKGAIVVLFGLGDPNNPPLFNQYNAFQKELVIKTSFVNPHTTQRAINLLSHDQIHCDDIIVKIMDPEEVPKELATKTYFNKGKVLVRMSGKEN